jgi:hypothetical protein
MNSKTYGNPLINVKSLLLSLSMLILASCAINVPEEVLNQAYQASIQDARDATPNEISTELIPITSYNTNLNWEGEPGNSRLLVVTWTSWDGYQQHIGTGPFNTARELWVTAAPELKNWIKANPLALIRTNRTVRLEQLLGLPPDNSHKWFVELWVNPNDLFRPSPDPEITDREAGLTFPQSEQFVTVSTDYVTWFNNLLSISYDGPNAHPWTRLGYTYDWGFFAPDRIGLSEFVVQQNAQIEVSGVWATEEYGN